MKLQGRFWLRPLTQALARCLASMAWSALAVGLAHACICQAISPAQGVERAEYVFIGKVVETVGNTWTVDVDRAGKAASSSPLA